MDPFDERETPITGDIPSPSEAEEGTREQILAIALHRFARSGYSKTAVKDIAADAGVTTGAIYYYFGSKPGLYREAGQASIGRLKEAWERITPEVAAQPSRRKRVHALFAAVAASAHDHEDNHWLGIGTEMDAARYPDIAETRDEWARDLEQLYRLAAQTEPRPDKDGWDRDPVAVLINVFMLGGSCMVVRSGPAAAQPAYRGLARLLAGPAAPTETRRRRTESAAAS